MNSYSVTLNIFPYTNTHYIELKLNDFILIFIMCYKCSVSQLLTYRLTIREHRLIQVASGVWSKWDNGPTTEGLSHKWLVGRPGRPS